MKKINFYFYFLIKNYAWQAFDLACAFFLSNFFSGMKVEVRRFRLRVFYSVVQRKNRHFDEISQMCPQWTLKISAKMVRRLIGPFLRKPKHLWQVETCVQLVTGFFLFKVKISALDKLTHPNPIPNYNWNFDFQLGYCT